MKRIPALLLSIVIAILYHYSLSLSTVYAETIDISPQPEYGDTINIQTGASSKEDLKGEIGPSRPNQLKFPELSKEEEFYSREDGFFNALPQDIQRDLKFNDPSLQRIEAELKGKIAHPACGELIVTKSSYNPDTGETNKEVEKDKQTPIKSDPVYFTPSQDFFQTILRTRFWQSFIVPNKGSDLNFNIAKPTESAAAARLADCVADKSGKTSEIITVANDSPRSLVFLGGLFDGIINFFQQLLAGKLFGGVTVEAKLEQTKYLPGETVLADQTVGGNGFLNFFKPEGAKFTNQGDEEEQVQYKVLKDNRDVGVTYKGVSSLKGGTLDLVKSLYPEGMAPESLAEITTAPPQGNLVGYIPPGPLATGLPTPKSKELENLIKSAATAFGVPIPVLSAVAWTESWHQNRGMWDYTDEEILRYSASGAQSPLNPEPNGCRAAGPMQFLIGGVATSCGDYTGQAMPNVWGDYQNAVRDATGENREPNPFNIKDSIFAAAKKLKGGSGTSRDDTIWGEQSVRNSISAWYGSCKADSITQARFGPGKGFCDFVWEILEASRQGSF